MSNNRITANPEQLLQQASMTASQYFNAAIQTIDHRFGVGYAEKHPELIAAFLKTAASDYNTAIAVQAFQDGIDVLAGALSRGD